MHKAFMEQINNFFSSYHCSAYSNELLFDEEFNEVNIDVAIGPENFFSPPPDKEFFQINLMKYEIYLRF